jgi:hypothetical protein
VVVVTEVSYPFVIIIFWAFFGWFWGQITLEIIRIWLDRPLVIYDDNYGTWRSARLVNREQSRS